ncbi:MAG: tetratricopeptide repeat protein [Chloroflexi bacterium]|nr:tetratricopeptide repeat protein [Chloroflexota bacterium]
MVKDALALSEKGKEAFQKGDFEKAIQSFSDAAKNYATENKPLSAAEERNNLSVALLQAEKAEEALEAAEGTDAVFAEAGDKLKQAMALGNQAAALDELGDLDKAIALYQQSASLFAEIGEGDYQETVLKSIAAIELRSGKLQNTAQTMLASLGANKNPNLFQRFLKFILRIVR